MYDSLNMMTNRASVCSSSFSTVAEILPEDKDTWAGRTFVTIDTDWACDEILEFTHSLVSDAGMPATWFFTNSSPVADLILDKSSAEVGIHPNFNPLMEGSAQNQAKPSCSSEVLEELVSKFPRSRSVRSHSLLQSERLIDEFTKAGLTHISNTFIPGDQNSEIRPWRIWGGASIVPHNWQDNVSLRMPLEFPGQPGHRSMRVLDFHPIHIFLNTSDLAVYEATRHLHRKPRELGKYVSGGHGIRKDFETVLEQWANVR